MDFLPGLSAGADSFASLRSGLPWAGGSSTALSSPADLVSSSIQFALRWQNGQYSPAVVMLILEFTKW
jgi:hypothetical protein